MSTKEAIKKHFFCLMIAIISMKSWINGIVQNEVADADVKS